jgi:TonB family protein
MKVSSTLRRLGLGFAALGGLAVLVLLVQWLMRGSAIPYKTAPQTVQMRLVEMPPPPPPPPPPEQKMVEVKKVPEFTEQPPPEQQQAPPTAADEPPPQGPLALDVQGQGAADGFGLAGRPGGADTLGTGSGGGSRFGWYSALVQGRISQALQQQRRLYDARYEVPALIWIRPDGSVERVQLIESSGKAEIDRLLVRTIEAMPRLPQPPPHDMPQPIATRISAT